MSQTKIKKRNINRKVQKMKVKNAKLMIAAAAAAIAFQTVAAEPAAAPAAPAKPAAAEPAKPAPTIESVLSFLPETLAEVGGVKITKQQLVASLSARNVPVEMLAQIPPEMLKNLLFQQISEMVDQQVFLSLAEKAGFKPSAELVKTEMAAIFAKLPKEQKEALESNLKGQGKSFDAYCDETAKNPDAQKYYAISAYLTKNVIAKIKESITDADAEKFYRENQAKFAEPCITVSHILVMVNGRDETGKPLDAAAKTAQKTAAKTKIEGIYAKLKQGEKFEALAEQESNCPSGKQTKGKLPSFTQDGAMKEGGRMDPTFTAAAFKLQKPGEISEIVETPFGYHILRLEDKKAPAFTPFNDVKEEIKSFLVNEKVGKEIRALIDAAKKEAGVKLFVEAPKAPAAAPAAVPAK